jgi:hypothetical protein
MDGDEINDSYFTTNGGAMATIIARTPEDGIRLFAEKLGLLDATRIEGLKGVVFLTYPMKSVLYFIILSALCSVKDKISN